MDEIDRIAEQLREAYAEHDGDNIVSWHDAEHGKQEAWRAIARKAAELGAKP